MEFTYVFFGCIVALVVASLLAIAYNRHASKSWMDSWAKQLQKEKENDEGRVSAVGDADSGSTPPNSGGNQHPRYGSEGARQEDGGPDDAVRRNADQVGAAPFEELTNNDAKARTEIVRILITEKLAYLERERRSPDIVAKFREIARVDPTLARLLDEVDYASIKPMRQVLDHLRRKEMLKLVRPEKKNDQSD